MYAKYGKRALDIALAGTGAVILFVPILFIVLVIKLDSRGPVLFRQPRYGKDKKSFIVYKFRTMLIDAPANMPTNSFVQAGSYITRSGRVMRKLSIDELPQIINVLGGDMSIVGPRPVILDETQLIELREECGANSVKPGITGWAQVNGRDELDDIIKARMDGQYVANLGLLTDIKILLQTTWVIISAAGHIEGHESKQRTAAGEEVT